MGSIAKGIELKTEVGGGKGSGYERCPRCGGFMVPDRFYDWVSDSGRLEFEGARCVACGEIIDPLILAHREYPAGLPKRHPLQRRNFRTWRGTRVKSGEL